MKAFHTEKKKSKGKMNLLQQFALKYSREETRQGHEVERKPWG